MQGTGKATGTAGYNVQCAVEVKHHLVVAHEVTNAINDRSQLLSMAKQAKAALGAETMEAFADRGYYKAEEVLACEGTGILPCVPKTPTSNNPNRGLFSGQHFIYDAKTDSYTCPAGASLTKGAVRSDRRDNIGQYRNLTACLTCALKPRCTPDNKVKRVKRWQHEGVLDKMQASLDRMPDAMTIRRQTAEHAFGTLKFWMGATHFLTKTLENVRTEMSLQVLAYNMKRTINMFGVKPLIAAIAA
jgi:Transposase DDE domain